MSLVEKALKKLQATQSAPPKPAVQQHVVVGSVVDAPIPVLNTPHAPRRSNKVVRIDRDALRRAGLLPAEAQERRLANEYRKIKRPLLAAALGRGVEKVPDGHLIMVASALPGEGKTFTCVNLAMSLAMEKDISVLLVDGDLAKPHISRTFGVDQEPGLLSALQDPSVDIESTVIPTDIEGLSLLPAGATVETATELLASDRMKEVVARLRDVDATRIVVFDSPPLLLTNESRVLTDVVGQVVIVVRAGVTERAAVMEAVACVNEARVVSLILNQDDSAGTANYYGYGYGYGEYGGSSQSGG